MSERHYEIATPLRCPICDRPMGYLMSNIAKPLWEFVFNPDIATFACELCFNKRHEEPGR